MKAAVEDETLQGKINDEARRKTLDKCNEIINWLDENQTAGKEEAEHLQQEPEKVCSPIRTTLQGVECEQEACQGECLQASPRAELLHLVVPPLGHHRRG